jgi:hypothetical protein
VLCWQAQAALKVCNGSLERAADWLFSHGDALDAEVEAINNPSAPSTAPATATGVKSSTATNLFRDY